MKIQPKPTNTKSYNTAQAKRLVIKYKKEYGQDAYEQIIKDIILKTLRRKRREIKDLGYAAMLLKDAR